MEFQKTNSLITKTAVFVPFLYLVFIAGFFFWVRLNEGHFPTYGNPDPKSYPVLLFIEIILLLLTPVGFLLWIIVVFVAVFRSDWRPFRWWFMIGGFGYLMIILLVKFDPIGILNWLAD